MTINTENIKELLSHRLLEEVFENAILEFETQLAKDLTTELTKMVIQELNTTLKPTIVQHVKDKYTGLVKNELHDYILNVKLGLTPQQNYEDEED